ncbi:hypothetical protein AKG34_23325 [Peribacillus butanolivorans]|nr:hypothetical protein AKG34_23325 [Peribacillus butanolivorans]
MKDSLRWPPGSCLGDLFFVGGYFVHFIFTICFVLFLYAWVKIKKQDELNLDHPGLSGGIDDECDK